MEDLPILQESIQKFDVPYKTATVQKIVNECWECVHLQMKSERIIVIPWSMPGLSGEEQHNLFLTMKSLLVSELNKDNELFGRKPCKKQ